MGDDEITTQETQVDDEITSKKPEDINHILPVEMLDDEKFLLMKKIKLTMLHHKKSQAMMQCRIKYKRALNVFRQNEKSSKWSLPVLGNSKRK